MKRLEINVTKCNEDCPYCHYESNRDGNEWYECSFNNWAQKIADVDIFHNNKKFKKNFPTGFPTWCPLPDIPTHEAEIVEIKQKMGY